MITFSFIINSYLVYIILKIMHFMNIKRADYILNHTAIFKNKGAEQNLEFIVLLYKDI